MLYPFWLRALKTIPWACVVYGGSDGAIDIIYAGDVGVGSSVGIYDGVNTNNILPLDHPRYR